jgi:hypothetical protein
MRSIFVVVCILLITFTFQNMHVRQEQAHEIQ